MSRHRLILVALATVFTAGITSAAFAGCCDWGGPAPVVYSGNGCGGCGAAFAPVTYGEPVAPLMTPPAVAAGWGGWGGGCGCGGCGCGSRAIYATPGIEPMPIAPAPIYVVNQGPDYAGPGLMVPYRVYAPGAGYAPPAAYSYMGGDAYPADYALNPYYAGAGPLVPYRARGFVHRPYYAPYPHHRLGARY